MVIVDTSVWIDLLNQRLTPQTNWLLTARHSEPVGLTTLTLTEVLQGIRFDNRFHEAQRYLKTLPVFETVSSTLATQSAQNFRTLSALGITIRSTVDCILATFCIEEGHRLLHFDADFEYFERNLGLKVVHP